MTKINIYYLHPCGNELFSSTIMLLRKELLQREESDPSNMQDTWNFIIPNAGHGPQLGALEAERLSQCIQQIKPVPN